MAAKKKKTAEGPSPLNLLVEVIVLAGLGMFLGFLYLASQSPTKFNHVQERAAAAAKAAEADEASWPKPEDAYYFEGLPSRDSNWEAKRERLLKGGSGQHVFTDREINSWMQSQFRTAAPPGAESAKSRILVIPGIPNVYIDPDGELYLHVPAEVKLFGSGGKYIFSARGGFSEGAQPRFKLEAFRVNSAPVPVTGGLARLMFNALRGAFAEAEDYQALEAAWEHLESVVLADGNLELELR